MAQINRIPETKSNKTRNLIAKPCKEKRQKGIKASCRFSEHTYPNATRELALPDVQEANRADPNPHAHMHRNPSRRIYLLQIDQVLLEQSCQRYHHKQIVEA